ncbi:hypothetical protein [Patulibacter minatonensis]|uniref:hypothetical protein n=1 Tax=Patulibacter minatonensis TaxID=298163 RepID=UPI0004AE027C|nr:hypothetical protein [Patulibacter minatonensis]
MRTTRPASPLHRATIRPVALTLAVLAPLALTACGGASDHDRSASPAARVAAPAPSPTAEPSPPVAASDGRVEGESADASVPAAPAGGSASARPGDPAGSAPTTADASDRTADDVRKAEARYLRALHDRDPAAVCRMMTGWTRIPGGRLVPCRTAYGRIIAQSPRFPAVSRREIASMRVEVRGSKATVTDPVPTIPTYFRKVHGAWKVDMVAMASVD